MEHNTNKNYCHVNLKVTRKARMQLAHNISLAAADSISWMLLVLPSEHGSFECCWSMRSQNSLNTTTIYVRKGPWATTAFCYWGRGSWLSVFKTGRHWPSCRKNKMRPLRRYSAMNKMWAGLWFWTSQHKLLGPKSLTSIQMTCDCFQVSCCLQTIREIDATSQQAIHELPPNHNGKHHNNLWIEWKLSLPASDTDCQEPLLPQ